MNATKLILKRMSQKGCHPRSARDQRLIGWYGEFFTKMEISPSEWEVEEQPAHKGRFNLKYANTPLVCVQG